MWFYLLSGLFLGWSLGANDSANIFGTAVGTKMLRFKTAALIASIFVVLGAVISGAGASHTLGKLGSINALGGAFTVALAAGITVFWMTKLGLPVSTTQAIVGAIVGWDLFSGFLIDTKILTKIVLTWIVCYDDSVALDCEVLDPQVRHIKRSDTQAHQHQDRLISNIPPA